MKIIGLGCTSPLGEGTEALQQIDSDTPALYPQKAFDEEELSETLFYQGNTSETQARSAFELAFNACKTAIADSHIDYNSLSTRNVALVLATGAGETNLIESDRNNNGNDGGEHNPYYLAELLAQDLGIQGVFTTVSNACSSAGYALAVVEDLLSDHETVIFCGVEAKSIVSQATFKSLLVLDPVSCRPFSEDRKGTVFGCGAAALVFTANNIVPEKCYASVLGSALNCDAYHPTAPEPSGAEIRKTILSVLAKAGLNPEDIDLFIPHATGTVLNDNIEKDFLSDIFGDSFNSDSTILVKKYIGHTGGASMAFSFIVAAQKLLEKQRAEEKEPSFALISSTSFGGNNSSTIFGLPQEYSSN